MHFELVDPSNADPELLCPLCQNVWDNPVELDPCGDIFCGACLKVDRIRQSKQMGANTPFRCPTCESEVQQEKQPNRVLVNVAGDVVVRCSECRWEGARRVASKHTCATGGTLRRRPSSRKGVNASSAPVLAVPSSQKSSKPAHPPPPSPHSPGSAPFHRNGVNSSSASAAATADTSTPLPARQSPRRAEDTSESALLRNFQYIEEDDQLDEQGSSLLPSLCRAPGDAAGGITSSSGGGNVDSGDHNRPYAPFPILHRSSLSLPSIHTATGNTHPPHQDSGAFPPVSDSAVWDSGNANGNANGRGGDGGSGGGSGGGNAPWAEWDLPQVEYDQLMSVFLQFDEEFTGRLGLHPFQSFARCLNYVNNDDDGARLFADIDTHHRGFITFADFCRWRRNNRPPEELLYGMTTFEYTDAILKFRSVDPQFVGAIGWEAFRRLCLESGLAQSEPQAVQLFNYCNDQQLGFVSLDQFLRMMQQLNAGRLPLTGSDGGGSGAERPRQTGGYAHSPSAGDARSALTPSHGSTAVRGGRSTLRQPNAQNSHASPLESFQVLGSGSGGVPAGGGAGGRPRGTPRAPQRQPQGAPEATLPRPPVSPATGGRKNALTPTAPAGRNHKSPVVRLNPGTGGGKNGGEDDCSVM